MIIVNVLNRSHVVDLGMERIKLLESAIQELHDAKMKAVEKTFEQEKQNAVVEAIQICCLLAMLLILA